MFSHKKCNEKNAALLKKVDELEQTVGSLKKDVELLTGKVEEAVALNNDSIGQITRVLKIVFRRETTMQEDFNEILKFIENMQDDIGVTRQALGQVFSLLTVRERGQDMSISLPPIKTGNDDDKKN